jgi:hypothetical protein
MNSGPPLGKDPYGNGPLPAAPDPANAGVVTSAYGYMPPNDNSGGSGTSTTAVTPDGPTLSDQGSDTAPDVLPAPTPQSGTRSPGTDLTHLPDADYQVDIAAMRDRETALRQALRNLTDLYNQVRSQASALTGPAFGTNVSQLETQTATTGLLTSTQTHNIFEQLNQQANAAWAQYSRAEATTMNNVAEYAALSGAFSDAVTAVLSDYASADNESVFPAAE